MTPHDGLLVGAAGIAAGAVNAVAGGGTLISFPALLLTGMTARTANITSSVGLIWGYAGGSVAYRRELVGQRVRIVVLGLFSVLGGVAGALTLLLTPARFFGSPTRSVGDLDRLLPGRVFVIVQLGDPC